MLMPDRLTRVVRWIIAATILFSAACWLAFDLGFTAYASSLQRCTTDGFFSTLWLLPSRLFTYLDPSELVVQTAILWFFGCPVEEKLGSGRYAALFFSCALAIWLVTSLFAVPNYAPWAGVVATLVAYFKLFPEEKSSIVLLYPVNNSHLALVVLAMHVYFRPAIVLEAGIAASLAYFMIRPAPREV